MVNLGFWSHFAKASRDKPILCLAPMADVTDVAFRHIIAKYSKQIIPHVLNGRGVSSSVMSRFNLDTYVTFTEFVSADGLILAPEAGRKKLLKDLEYSEIERPIVAQFFTSRPEIMEKVAELAVELGFDGVDINMGCPDKSIEKQGAGAALIKNPKLAQELIAAAKQGVQKKYKDAPCTGEKCGVIPISVKTRLGYNQDELETWLPELLKAEPAVITIHARTRKEMSKVPAKWERIRRAVEIRDEVQEMPRTLIFGNGDVRDVSHVYELAEQTGTDGVMLGRAIFGRPYLLSNSYEWYNRKSEPEVIKKILDILIEHTQLFEEKLGGVKSFAIMKKHFKAYLKDLSNTSQLRMELMETQNAKEVRSLILKWQEQSISI